MIWATSGSTCSRALMASSFGQGCGGPAKPRWYRSRTLPPRYPATCARGDARRKGDTMPAKKNHPDTPYVEELVERLSAFAPVSARFMFGGYGLFVDGVMFGLVDDGALYLRADDLNRPTFEAINAQPWTPEMNGKTSTMPYYALPEDDADNIEALRPWFE